jgi:hypothetical protein
MGFRMELRRLCQCWSLLADDMGAKRTEIEIMTRQSCVQ